MYSYVPETGRACYRQALRLLTVPAVLIVLDTGVCTFLNQGDNAPGMPTSLIAFLAIPVLIALSLPVLALTLDRARRMRRHAIDPVAVYRYTVMTETEDGDIDTHAADFLGSDHCGFNTWIATLTSCPALQVYVDRNRVVAGGVTAPVRLIPAK